MDITAAADLRHINENIAKNGGVVCPAPKCPESVVCTNCSQLTEQGVDSVVVQLSFKLWRQCNLNLVGNTPALLYGVSFANTDFAKYNPAYDLHRFCPPMPRASD